MYLHICTFILNIASQKYGCTGINSTAVCARTNSTLHVIINIRLCVYEHVHMYIFIQICIIYIKMYIYVCTGINSITVCARTNSTLPARCITELMTYTGTEK
jgi:hypothetical protein